MTQDMEDEWSDDLPWSGQYILDENGDAVRATGLRAWGQWMQKRGDQHILARDQIGNSLVSTVFLGLDHTHYRLVSSDNLDSATYKPTLWETMIFGGQHDQFQNRYTSREDALVGHGKIVQMLTS